MSEPVGYWILGWCIVGLAIVGLYAIASAVVDALASRRTTDRIPTFRTPMPIAYVGCITCEAAGAVSSAALCRHQGRDHTDGIRW